MSKVSPSLSVKYTNYEKEQANMGPRSWGPFWLAASGISTAATTIATDVVESENLFESE